MDIKFTEFQYKTNINRYQVPSVSMIFSGSWTIRLTGWNYINQKENELSYHESLSDLQWVKEVEDHLQERTEDNADCAGHEEGDDSLVGIVLFSSSSDGLLQKPMSVNDVDPWV